MNGFDLVYISVTQLILYCIYIEAFVVTKRILVLS